MSKNLERIRDLIVAQGARDAVCVCRIEQFEEESFQVRGPLPKTFCRWLEQRYRPKGPRQASQPYPLFDCRRCDPGVSIEWVAGTARNARFYRIDLAQLEYLCSLAVEVQR